MRLIQRDAQFRDFFMSDAARLERIALLMTGNPETAKDLTQDTLVKTYRAWGRITGDDPGPYARQALINLCRNHHRRRSLELTKGAAIDVKEVTDPDVAETIRVANALASLPPLRRAVMVLRYYEDMTEAEVARVLDRPLNTVKSDIRRSLERLRPLLAEGAKTP
jgi:RNA polymerase sigma-70 factor (sigma-E family)